MNVNTIRAGVAALFPSLHAYTTATAPEAPAAVISFPEVTFDTTLGGVAQLDLTVSIGTSTQSEIKAEEFLADQVSGIRDVIQVTSPLWRSAKVIKTGRPYNTEVGQSTFRWVDVSITIFA